MNEQQLAQIRESVNGIVDNRAFSHGVRTDDSLGLIGAQVMSFIRMTSFVSGVTVGVSHGYGAIQKCAYAFIISAAAHQATRRFKDDPDAVAIGQFISTYAKGIEQENLAIIRELKKRAKSALLAAIVGIIAFLFFSIAFLGGQSPGIAALAVTGLAAAVWYGLSYAKLTKQVGYV